MEDQHFRLRGHAAATSLDATGYVDCRGHARALAYLQHAVLQGDSFVVLTGDAGMGKTMLVRKLLQGLGTDGIVPAMLGARRFDTAALLAGISKSFGAPVAGHSADELRAGLQAFLATLTASGRRALLVVDDAQQLLSPALAELIELSKLRSRRDAPLQVVLAGRAELRATLQPLLLGGAAEPVFLFCDLAPLSAPETRAYAEQRLHRLQPVGRLTVGDAAGDRIHRESGGVPRAIDRLCDLLLAAAAPRPLDRVTPELIDLAIAPSPAAAEANLWRGSEAPSGAIATPAVARRRAAAGVGGSLGTSPRGPVVLVTLLVVASLAGGVVHEYQGVIAEARLSSLAQATRIAPAAAAVVTPDASRASPVDASPPPAPPVSEASRWLGVANAEQVALSKAQATPLSAPAQAPARPPAAGPCSAAVVALALCSTAQNP